MWLVAALFYGYEFLHRLAPGVIANELILDLAIPASKVGTLSAYYFYAYAATQVPAGILIDRFGLKKILVFACMCVALGSALFSGAQDMMIGRFSRALIGFGSAFAFAGTLKVASEQFSSRLFALFVGVTNTIGVLGALCGQYPYANLVENVGWRHSMMMIAFLGGFISLALWLIVRDSPQLENERQKHRLWEGLIFVARQPQVWWIACIAALRVTPIISFAELWAVPFFSQCYGTSILEASKMLSFIFIGIAIGGPVHGFLARVILRRRLLFIGGAGSFVCTIFLLSGLTLGNYVLILILALLGFFSSSMLLCFGMSVDRVPLWAKGAVIGFTNMWVMLFGALLQPLIGYLLERQAPGCALDSYSFREYRQALYIVPLCLLISLVLTWFLKFDYFKPNPKFKN